MVAQPTVTANESVTVVHPFTRMQEGVSADHFYSDAQNRLRGDEPGPEWLIDGLLPVGVSVLIADPGAGKSMVTQQILHHLCYGRPLGDWDSPGLGGLQAWVIDLEGDPTMNRERSYSITPYGELAGDQQGEERDDHYIWYASWVMPPAEREAYRATYHNVAAYAHIAYVRDQLADAKASGHPIKLVVIDTLQKFMGPRPAKANAYEWEAHAVGELNRIAVDAGCAMIIIHHTNKAGEVSGSTGIAGSATVAMKLDVTHDEDEDTRVITTTGVLRSLKNRYAAPFAYPVAQLDDGTWEFTDQLGGREAVAIGHRRMVLARLRQRGAQSRGELRTLEGIGTSLGKVLDRMRRDGQIRSAFGRWQLVAETFAGELVSTRPGPELPLCTVCATELRRATPGQTMHPGCEPAELPSDVEDQADDQAPVDDVARFDALKILRESLEASRMHPVNRISPDHREHAPWSLVTERMTGEHRWSLPALPMGERVIVLDRNGSYPSAAGSAQVAANLLAHTGPMPEIGTTGGIYLIDPVAWTDDRIGHPLGRLAEADGPLWVSAPHLRQLEKLAREKSIAAPVIRDSWTGRGTGGLFTGYSKAIRAAREAATGAEYVAVKRRSSIALRLLWPKGEKIRSPFWRPDWSVAIRAEAAVRHWRVAWTAVQDGAQLVQLGAVDEAAFLAPLGAGDDWLPTGYELGAGYGKVKIKDTIPAGDWSPRRKRDKQ